MRSCATAAEDTLGIYGMPAAIPFPADATATFGTLDPRDDDIEFDFFDDEPPTTEAQSPSRVRLPRRGGRGTRPPSGPPHGLTPALRLLALVAIIVALFVFFGLVIQSCASTSKHDQYKHYMDKMRTIA